MRRRDLGETNKHNSELNAYLLLSFSDLVSQQCHGGEHNVTNAWLTLTATKKQSSGFEIIDFDTYENAWKLGLPSNQQET